MLIKRETTSLLPSLQHCTNHILLASAPVHLIRVVSILLAPEIRKKPLDSLEWSFP